MCFLGNCFPRAVLREPYRLFFPLGIVAGLIGVGQWVFYAMGWIGSYSGTVHSSIQMLVYMNCFVSGFFLTAMPRFTESDHTTKGELSLILLFILGMAVFIFKRNLFWADACFLGWLMTMTAFVVRRIMKKRKVSSTFPHPPASFIWLPMGVVHGVVGTVLYMLGQTGTLSSWSLLVGKPMMEQGFLLCMVIGIGSFLIPKLFGTSDEAPSNNFRMRPFFHLVAGIILFLSFWLEANSLLNGYSLRACVLLVLLFNSRFFKTGVSSKPLNLFLLQISVGLLVMGYLISAFSRQYHLVMLHIALIGGLSLMTFCIGTVVVMNHAGEGEQLKRPLWIYWVAGIGLLLSLLARIAVIFWPTDYLKWLGISGALWSLTAFLWLCFILPRLFKVPEGEESEQQLREAEDHVKCADHDECS